MRLHAIRNFSGLCFITAFFAATSAHATLSVYEGFDYTASATLEGLNGGSGFATTGTFSAWDDDQVTAAGMAKIQANSLQYSNLLTTGNSLVDKSSTSNSSTTSFGTLTRELGIHLMPLNETDQRDFWISLLVRREANATSNGNGKNGFRLQLSGYTSGASGQAPRIAFGDDQNTANTNDTYAIWTEGAGSSITTTYATANAVSPDVTSDVSTIADFLVFKLSFNAGASIAGGLSEKLRLFVNPTPGAIAPLDTNAVATMDTTANITDLGLVDFQNFYGATQFSFDELRIGDTYQDVAPAVPEPSSTVALLAGLAVLGCVWRRRRA